MGRGDQEAFFLSLWQALETKNMRRQSERGVSVAVGPKYWFGTLPFGHKGQRHGGSAQKNCGHLPKSKSPKN